MSDTYEPPKVWEWKQNSNQAFANINRPTAGAQQEKELPIPVVGWLYLVPLLCRPSSD